MIWHDCAVENHEARLDILIRGSMRCNSVDLLWKRLSCQDITALKDSCCIAEDEINNSDNITFAVELVAGVCIQHISSNPWNVQWYMTEWLDLKWKATAWVFSVRLCWRISYTDPQNCFREPVHCCCYYVKRWSAKFYFTYAMRSMWF